jgi:hypothetical protein
VTAHRTKTAAGTRNRPYDQDRGPQSGRGGKIIKVGQSRINGLINGIGTISIGDLEKLTNGFSTSPQVP